jgi:DNA-binding CsgD family transcriptional regulator
VPESTAGFLDSTQLLFDLQQGNEIARSLSGCLEPEAIARRVTDGMVAEFGCAFARIWLVESDRAALRLVASSGMYTRIDGSFARVPMGAFKVGKIAQNGIPFLSNALADETWVRDRDWAIANSIHGFAGYPLVAGGDVVGVLAVFSRQAMAPEFLEVLQSLCATVTIALEMALHHQQATHVWQQEKQTWLTTAKPPSLSPLSEQLASILAHVRLTLVGSEIPLSAPLTALFLRAAEILREMQCMYCRLTYGTAQISLEAMTAPVVPNASGNGFHSASPFGELLFAVSCLGGSVQSYAGADQRATQVLLSIPYPGCALGPRLHILCGLPVLQMAFTHLAYLAGLTVCASIEEAAVPVLTDQPALLETNSPLLWVATHTTQPVPKQASAKLDLTIAPMQLRAAVEAVSNGETWGLALKSDTESKKLSEREQEIMTLLAQGLRDRDIASTLHISDRTVKFHINNILVKLKAKTRFQALYQVTSKGWINPELLARSQSPASN